MFAAETDQAEIVRYLVQEGKAKVEAQTVNNSTAIMWSADNEKVEALQMLLDLGANAYAHSNVRLHKA